MTRRSLRWRFDAFASGLVVVTLGLLGAASVTPVNAGGAGALIDMGGWWKDPWCGTSAEQFVIRVWKNTGFSGESWKFCTDYPDFCNAPYGSTSSDALLCATGYDGATANDKASSFRVSAVRGGVTCEVVLRTNRNYGGAALGFAFNAPYELANMGPLSDMASSVDLEC